MLPRYPEVRVRLDSEYVYTLVSRVRSALHQAGVSSEECTKFSEAGYNGTYDEAVAVIREWVTVE